MIGLQDNSSDALPPPPPPSRAPEFAAKLFSAGGWLQASLKLEHRPQQEKMARAVSAAMKGDESLLFEAGTGVGKSLAYLLPGIVHAMDQSRQMIVSTHTIALQEQLDQKDLPLCRRVFAASPETESYASFKSAMLVGKSNYLCTSRLAHALQDKNELFATPEHEDLQRIAAWAETTTEGLRHELNPAPLPEVWEMVNADSSGCARKYCDCNKCPYQRARTRIRAANVIIVNHSLLFAHINAGGAAEKGATRGVLFPDDFLVLDEAHTVPEVATDHCGLRLSSYGVDRMLKYLYNPKARRGLLQKHGDAVDRQLVVDVLEAAHQFFAFLDERLLTKQTIVRVRAEGFAEAWMDGPLLALHKAVKTRADRMDDGRERDELLEQAGKVKTLQGSLRAFLAVADADKTVYWVERMGKRQTIVALRTAPIDVAPFIREELLKRGTSVVFTSATLAMGGRIEPFQARIGAQHVTTAVEHSPFDFERKMRVFVAADVPLPTPQEARLALDVLIDYIDFCTRRTKGGTLVLFTSYFDMKRVAEAMEPIYDGALRPFFMQGRDYSRTELARKLREAGNGILFGTDSFWTGIDVPGDALAQVIITRLPFEVPTHPVLEARTEWIRERGGNPFSELTLPDALITFRQGIGRLIRTANDRGVITILDSRVTQKAYGRLFLDCIPQKNAVRMNRENRIERFQPFI
ncbi:ATP-dependent DNA helicase [Rariglobus hedericola]|uniref:ATP-dependent DNA helicase n=1 Tax=Rariglobus hedericola TaxID=2597822 RepID=A0A556QMZ0_9BACT|nr:helicase C-terminal domain-containing protein [Rariglobus hedericola]TSJ78005.1 ATP-dependent DNA helicase [Rariglobus hedericola]